MSRKRIWQYDEPHNGTASVKVFKDSDTQEFVARVYQKGIAVKDSDYFTNDKKDAIYTAKAMLNHLNNYSEDGVKYMKKNPRKRRYVPIKKTAAQKKDAKRRVRETNKNIARGNRALKKNPSAHRTPTYFVQYQRNSETEWRSLAHFPRTPEGKKNAIQYARAYHKVFPQFKVSVR